MKESGNGKPHVIIANTTKGKGISFVEGQPQYHNAMLSDEQLRQALEELEAALEATEVA